MYILLATKYKKLQDGSLTFINNRQTQANSLREVKEVLQGMDIDSTEFPSWLIEEDHSVRDSVSHIIELSNPEGGIYHCRVIVF